MNLDNQLIKAIIVKYINNNCSQTEIIELKKWLSQSEANQLLLDKLMNKYSLNEDLIHYNLFDKNTAWNKISPYANHSEAKIVSFNYRRIIYAASIVLILFSLSIAYFKYDFFTSTSKTLSELKEGKVLKDAKGEILPATTGAILVSSSGEKVELDNSFKINKDGAILRDGNEIAANNEANIKDSYYELIVPKAKVINFTMFDGSKIWVNANTRLRIPTNSASNERRIKLISGEIYLEVEKYKNDKFLVETEKGVVEVLGTKFNVSSSQNHFKTTLLEGSVKMSTDKSEIVLVPNMNGILHNDILVSYKANLSADLAWKNNIFYFNNYTITNIAKQIEDWYGVKVIINNNVIKNRSTYSGEIRRDVPLTELKTMLEFISGLQVTIVGDLLNVENK